MGNLSNGTQLEDEPSFSEYYTSGKRIANGTFATVKMCKRRADNKHFAVKIIKKNQLKEHELNVIKDEVNILKYLTNKYHPNIINMQHMFENDKEIKIVLELCQSDNLLDQLYDSPNKRFSECKAAKITFIIAKTLKYLHSNHIVHRDIKPENILFSENGILKIIDFGSAKHIKFDDGKEGGRLDDTGNLRMKTRVGTPYYVAPEIIANEYNYYDNKIDLWSLGAILYLMLSGFHPFSADNGLKKLYENIINGNYSFSSTIWNNISDDAIDLIQKLLTVDANKRIGCNELLKHKWILNYNMNN